MTTSDDVQAAIVAALTGTTVAQDRVYNPRTWPLAPSLYPTILVQSPKERKESKGKNAPAYDVFATFRLVARVTMKAQAGDAAAVQVLDALAAFQRQIEVAVINNYELYLIISEIASVDTVNEVKSEGNQPIGELTMDLQCVFYQGTEMFAPIVPQEITEFAAFADLINRFDPAVLYVPPFPYDTTLPPRSTGPDGRVEAGAVFALGEYDRCTDGGDSRVTDRGVMRVADASLGE